ncbi:galactose-1-epimerase [Mixta intestinalis]|uniref:Aldose 1-epimerase n=1 Tax=Mixta intestinalis TaxID=1615494 RepID=A0A6P1PX74_9GAMM|nr:galactose-1-epimerase [Mixta intestinalis]QHM70325.1 Aldose 1-epimerase [Mixta intestinalis]
MLNEATSLAPDGQPWRISVLRNRHGMVATFMDWGATWLSARVPMKDGSVREALLGCATPADYLKQTAYLGAAIGRYANRITNARLNEAGITLTPNQGAHQLHGGPEGFDRRRWQIVSQSDERVIYRLDSPDGDQGYPGNLIAQVEYRLDDNNSLSVSWEAQVDRACPVNLTSHAYFNLDAHHGDARQHRLQLNADYYLPVNSEGIPRAPLQTVENSGFDFRTAKSISHDFLQDEDQRLVQGYDHAFLLNAPEADRPAAQLWSADSKLKLTVETSAPALQFYSGNYLDGTPARDGGSYTAFQGIALESEFLPDSPNHPEWPQPSCWLQPGKTWQSVTRYTLTAE